MLRSGYNHKPYIFISIRAYFVLNSFAYSYHFDSELLHSWFDDAYRAFYLFAPTVPSSPSSATLDNFSMARARPLREEQR